LEARALDAGPSGLADVEVAARCGVSPAEAARLTARLAGAGRLARCGARWVAAAALGTVRQGVFDAIDVQIAAQPLAGGVARATLRALKPRRWPAEVVDHVIAELLASGVLAGDERLSRRHGGSQVQAATDAADAQVRQMIEAAGLSGTTLADLEQAATGLDRRALETVLSRLVRAQDAQRIGTFYVSAVHLRRMREVLWERAAGAGPRTVDIGWFKEQFGLTRRSAIPLLEWLDRARVTRRTGDTRVLIGP
ncbi:MAG: SelB C-terminal domain-containing protein, partial [Luteitalea sp.]